MRKTRPSFGTWIRNNWLELLLVAVFVAALVWILQTGRGLWEVANAEPTATPTARPLVEGRATRTPTVAPAPSPTPVPAAAVDGQRSLRTIEALAAMGSRSLGAAGHDAAAAAIAEELRQNGWEVTEQTVDVGGVGLRTIVGKAGSGPLVIVGTHYDTPPQADLDPVEANRTSPAPSANDGTSSVAVMLELARALDKSKLTNEVWLAFFDGQYPPPGGDPVSAGASALAESLPNQPMPAAVILLDFVGAAGQRFFLDSNSDPVLSQALWSLAQQLGYDAWFVPEAQGTSANGVSAFRQRGIPAANIVGIDYPYRRTIDDTVDKIDAASLERIGRLLQTYLEAQAP